MLHNLSALDRLPDLPSEQRAVFIVTNLTDEYALEARGLVAISDLRGPGQWRPSNSQLLARKGAITVAIVSDATKWDDSESGAIADSCRSVGLIVKIVRLPRPPAEWLVDHDGGDLMQIVVETAPLEATHVTPPQMWPRLAPEALYGLPGLIVRTLDPSTEADPVALLAHLLVGMGNLIGLGPHALAQGASHPLKLNVALVGRTSKGRKGTAWTVVRRLLRGLDDAWISQRVRQGLSTGEGLIHHVRDQREEQQPIRERGRVVDYQTVVLDPGEADKRLFVIAPEFAVVLRRMNREGNTLSAIIREAWDFGDLDTLTKASPERATGTHISIMGHITTEELRRYLTDTERANGFANRFLWLLVERSKVLPEGATIPEIELAPLVAELREVVAFARTVGEIRRDEDAKATWREIYPQLSAGEPGIVGAILSRAEAQVLRLSIHYAVLDRSATVRPPHLQAALAFWNYAEASARRIFSEQIRWSTADTILQAVKIQRALTSTQISALFNRHLRQQEITAALEQLEAAELIKPERQETGGRPSVLWRATE